MLASLVVFPTSHELPSLKSTPCDSLPFFAYHLVRYNVVEEDVDVDVELMMLEDHCNPIVFFSLPPKIQVVHRLAFFFKVNRSKVNFGSVFFMRMNRDGKEKNGGRSKRKEKVKATE